MKIERIKDKLIYLALIFSGIAILDIVFHPPDSMEEFVLRHVSRDKFKPQEFEIPEFPKLKDYLEPIAGRQIFVRLAKKRQITPEAGKDLKGYKFIGVVEIDRPYVAIYKVSTSEQYLVPEGGILDGIEIKEIGRGILTIDFYGVEKKILF